MTCGILARRSFDGGGRDRDEGNLEWFIAVGKCISRIFIHGDSVVKRHEGFRSVDGY